ncbi:MAG: bifunctional non-ous end joining protein LigD [Solirubrobacterales bacterium]|nr:bifunctional non-ous end joining protein LigD [Solirubrobacterales bacterium]
MAARRGDVQGLIGDEYRDRLRPGRAEFVAPMLATLTTSYFSDTGWLFERKLDGVRTLAVRGEHGTRLYSRNHKPMNAPYPEIAEALDAQAPDGMVADGEIVAFDGEQTSFSTLQARIGLSDPNRARATGVPVILYLFDLLVLDGHDLTGLPLHERKRLLRRTIQFADPIRFSEHRHTDGQAYLKQACASGWEGLIAKRAEATYHAGARSKDWLKFKCVHEQELVIGGFTDPAGSRTGFGALLLGYYEDGQLRYAGKVGTGFSDRLLRSLRARLEELTRSESPFADPVRERGAHWVTPELVAEVGFADWTRDHQLRHSRFLGLRDDKPATEVVREDPPPTDNRGRATGAETGRHNGGPAANTDLTEAPAPATWAALTGDELAALEELGAKGRWSIAGREVAVTNLDKVLFPARAGDPAVTKRDLLRYYAQVAPHLLPYLADRPVNLHRFPDGVDRAGFWQKQVPTHAPAWLTRWHNTEVEQNTEEYAILDSVAALVWMANYAAVELHPWTSRPPNVHEPTWALIDLDPGTDTTFDQILELARLYRTALAHLGVEAAPKVTGQRGIQIWVPIRPGYTFADTRAWVQQVSKAVGRTLPELISWEWHKDRRRGLARLDYTQNALNKTLVAPFSPRPAPAAPVSMPISWDELDDPDLRPDRWTIHTALPRLRDTGDPLMPLIGRHQDLPQL